MTCVQECRALAEVGLLTHLSKVPSGIIVALRVYFKEWKDDYGLGGDENPMMLTKVTDATLAKAATQANPNALDPGFHQSNVQSTTWG
jgi:hypothetical protein